ncbi:BTB and MATH domain-containing protein 36-like [Gigantopelta aegis]|uniref:BTB and MATH domain-containing protein 36-like n=1 Tax=Gigantopelta aegis TaxID=1735272 RepID=UPI001B88BA16|nr:BTB and MATH domain-containing protein 36-like [Gigantopelta aegis]
MAKFIPKEKQNLFGFGKPSEDTDVVLVVEERKLHVNKAILSSASPVFSKMFHGEFREKSKEEIPLPSKSCRDFLAFLLCLYPNTLDDVTYENIEVILPLAQEYLVKSLMKKCDVFLLGILRQSKYETVSNKELVRITFLADKFNLVDTLKKAVEMAASRPNIQLKKEPGFAEISDKTKVEILSRRCDLVETPGLVVSEDMLALVNLILPKNACCQHSEMHTGYCTVPGCSMSFLSSKFFRHADNLLKHKSEVEHFLKTFTNN